jgi:hypothetical protein
MPICDQYYCEEIIGEDAIDHKCFYCGGIFCIEHIGDYPAGSIKDARKRIEDIALMDIDDDYLEQLAEELTIAEDTYDDENELIVYSSIQFPICECCAENLSEKSEQWKKIIENES